MANQRCPLTGYEAKNFQHVGGANSGLLQYENEAVGLVLIGSMYYQELINCKEKKPLLAGYCRAEFESKRKPEVLLRSSVDEIFGRLKYPKTLKEKETYLLESMFERGGKEGKIFKLESKADYTLCFCSDAQELDAVMSNLMDREVVECKKTDLEFGNHYYSVRLKAQTIDAIEQLQVVEGLTASSQSAGGNQLTMRHPPFVHPDRLIELRGLANNQFDFSKLVRFCEELNDNYERGNCFSVVMLGRSIMNHVPPVFGFRTFDEFSAGYGKSSFKSSMNHLSGSLKNIADSYLHEPIRKRDVLPNTTQVNFSNDMDVLLGEVVRKISEG